MKRTIFLLAMVVFLSSNIFSQAIPKQINYQGILKDAAGNILTGDFSMTFKIYNDPSGGSALWTEIQPAVAVANGLFSVQLGSVTPITTVPFNRIHFLGITVGTESELSPRTLLSPSAYSFMSMNVLDSVITTSKIVDGAVTGLKIGSNAVVKSLNGLRDNVNLVAGSNITLTPSGNDLTISATGGGSGGTIDGSGTPNFVPLFTGPTTLGNSAIYQIDGNIVIGNMPPIAKLHVESDSNNAGYFASSYVGPDKYVLHAKYNGSEQSAGTAVYGESYGGKDYMGGLGGLFKGGAEGAIGDGGAIGLHGISTYGFGTGSIGVLGEASGMDGSKGVFGKATGGGSPNYGIYGLASNGRTNYGIYGTASGGQTNWAGYFDGNVTVKSNESTSPHHVLHSEFTGSGENNSIAVYGKSTPANGYGYGGIFQGGYRGVYAEGQGGSYSGQVIGVKGSAFGSAGSRVGIYGEAQGGTTNYGVYGYAWGTGTNYGVYANGDLAYTRNLIGPPSDMMLKQNITSFSSINKIMQLEPRTFNYSSDSRYAHMNLPSGTHYGLVAQELEKVFPELVVDAVNPSIVDKDGKKIGEEIHYKGVKYMELVPILIQAVKEQQDMIEELTRRIEDLERK